MGNRAGEDEESAVSCHVGERLRALRLQRRRSLDWLGEVLGRSQQQMSRYERGQSQLTAAQLYRLGRALDVPVGWFFVGYSQDSPEMRHASLIVGESRAGYRATGARDQEAALLEAWRRLPDERQRSLLLEFLEATVAGR